MHEVNNNDNQQPNSPSNDNQSITNLVTYMCIKKIHNQTKE